MQSHGGQVRHTGDFRHGCDNNLETTTVNRFNRRRVLRAATFGRSEPAVDDSRRARRAMVITGRVADVSPHWLNLQTPAGEWRLTLAPSTAAWRGSAVPAAAIKRGDRAVVRLLRPGLAERIWAQIGRVTGTIIGRASRDTMELLVDEGPAKGRGTVIIDGGSMRQIQVRFPRLDPGYLIDVIGLREHGYLRALVPATSQPPYAADHPPAPPLISGHIPDPVSGTVSWHEPGEEPDGLLGVAYPALDPETSCDHEPALDPDALDPHLAGGCVRLPYLSVGSEVRIRNDCSDRSAVLPVTSCGALSRLFCDRCVKCGTSPRGRVADLTMTAFAELGGNLEDACFNATMTVST